MTPSKPVLYRRSRPHRFRYETFTLKSLPCRSAFLAVLDSSLNGVSMEKPTSSASPDTKRCQYSRVRLPISHGEIAPSASVRSGSGMISSSSTCSCEPIPVQVVHAPNGLLKEKDRGSISSILRICPLGQESFSEKDRNFARPSSSTASQSPVFRVSGLSCASISTKSTTTTPSASCNDVSTESVRR